MGSFPTRFWMTQGWGIDQERTTNAYDEALYHAGLCDQNICALTSVPPGIQIQVPTRQGWSYIPGEGMLGGEHPLFSRLTGKAYIDKLDIPGDPVISDTSIYYQLPISTIIQGVVVTMKGDSFERITAALGLGRYHIEDEYGIFAFEEHGYKDPVGCVDGAVEGLLRMMEMRGREPLTREGNTPKDVKKAYKISTSKYEKDGRKIEFHARKEIHYVDKFDFEVYLCSMVVPEGFCGLVLSACIMDPFTEIHS